MVSFRLVNIVVFLTRCCCPLLLLLLLLSSWIVCKACVCLYVVCGEVCVILWERKPTREMQEDRKVSPLTHSHPCDLLATASLSSTTSGLEIFINRCAVTTVIAVIAVAAEGATARFICLFYLVIEGACMHK
ncbi:hypothetical protein B0T17DRAFT_193657 [Bombardia bombarda]|uniref:Uncharacterized protein n=1 Tax=Bombardia bombarda TaxID=252184 RepID=A0AA39X980_9PEZI|nr:hypothetical protein B0T17DRAFT_193657 [Bombardia bombarda]